MKVFKLFILACLFSSSSAYAVLSNNLTATVQGNVVSSGVGLRGTGTGDIVVSGVPGGASVSQAFLYWVTMGNSDTFTSPTLDGSPVSGSLIGTGGDTCWGAAGNYTYRADVTSTVTGNGTYTIAGLPNSGPSVDDSQGASLVVIYEDGASAVHNVVINDGSEQPMVSQLKRYRGKFTEQVKQGDRIHARGTLEKVESDGATFYRLVLGGRGDYLLSI